MSVAVGVGAGLGVDVGAIYGVGCIGRIPGLPPPPGLRGLGVAATTGVDGGCTTDVLVGIGVAVTTGGVGVDTVGIAVAVT